MPEPSAAVEDLLLNVHPAVWRRVRVVDILSIADLHRVIGHCPDVGEQHALEARTDRPHRLVRVLPLLDLDHTSEVLQLERTAEVVEGVLGERRLLSGKLRIIVVFGVADQLRRVGQLDRMCVLIIPVPAFSF